MFTNRKIYTLIAVLLTTMGLSTPTQSATTTAVSANKAEGNAGSTLFTFSVTRGVITSASVVNWAVSASTAPTVDATDFANNVYPTGSLSFPAGVATMTVSIPVKGDTTAEPGESFKITLLTVSAPVAYGTIQNDDLYAPVPMVKPLQPAGAVPFIGAQLKRRTGVAGCTAEVFQNEVAQHATDMDGYAYTVKSLDNDTAVVDTVSGRTIVIGTSQYTYNSFKNLGAYVRGLQFQYPAYTLDDLQLPTPAKIAADAVTTHMHNQFTNRMTCVRYVQIRGYSSAKSGPYSQYLDSNIQLTTLESKYPVDSCGIKDPLQYDSTVFVPDTIRSTNVYPDHKDKMITNAAPNFVNTWLEMGQTENDLVPDNSYTHADIMMHIINSITPAKVHTVYGHALWTTAGLGTEFASIVQWAINNKAAYSIKTINLSFGNEDAGNLPLETAAIQAAVAADIVVVQAAGNNIKGSITGPFPGVTRSPTNNPEIVVGSITSAGKITSSYGPGVGTDLVVRTSGNIVHAYHDNSTPPAFMEATTPIADNAGSSSAGAAVVSGVAAYMRSVFPHMTVAQVKEAMCNSADIIPIYTGGTAEENAIQATMKGYVGCGILNPVAAMDYAKAHWVFAPQCGGSQLASTPHTYFSARGTNSDLGFYAAVFLYANNVVAYDKNCIVASPCPTTPIAERMVDSISVTYSIGGLNDHYNAVRVFKVDERLCPAGYHLYPNNQDICLIDGVLNPP